MGEWAVVDDEGLGQIAQVGLFCFVFVLLRLADVMAFLDPFGAAGGASKPHQDLKKVPKNLAVVMETAAPGGGETNGDEVVEGEKLWSNLWSSTNTLRESALR